MRRSPEMNKGNKLSLLAYDFTLFDAWLLPPANVDNSSSMVEEIMTQAFYYYDKVFSYDARTTLCSLVSSSNKIFNNSWI